MAYDKELKMSPKKVKVNETGDINIDIVTTTKEHLQLVLKEYEEAVHYSDSWTGYAGITFTLLVALFTCDFKQLWVISAELIEAIFLVSSIVTGFMAVRSAWKSFFHRMSIQDVVKRLVDEDEKPKKSFLARFANSLKYLESSEDDK